MFYMFIYKEINSINNIYTFVHEKGGQQKQGAAITIWQPDSQPACQPSPPLAALLSCCSSWVRSFCFRRVPLVLEKPYTLYLSNLASGRSCFGRSCQTLGDRGRSACLASEGNSWHLQFCFLAARVWPISRTFREHWSITTYCNSDLEVSAQCNALFHLDLRLDSVTNWESAGSCSQQWRQC